MRNLIPLGLLLPKSTQTTPYHSWIIGILKRSGPARAQNFTNYVFFIHYSVVLFQVPIENHCAILTMSKKSIVYTYLVKIDLMIK